jgi:acetolactate decarboxylase
MRTFASTPHLYAIGPIEQLRGEVTVIDSRPSLSRVGPNRSILVAQNFETGAPYLVWAEVPAWRTLPIPPEVRSFTDLEIFIPRASTSVGLDPLRPVPFLVVGQEDLIEFHILNRDDEPYSPAKLKEIQFSFDVARADAIIVGFYSPSHRGVFTSMDSAMHIHFQTAKNDASGHIHALEIGAGAVLSLPHPV